MIVNDELVQHMMLSHHLEKNLGFKKENIQKAYDGLEAVEKAAASDFDLILMDLNMPRMNGYLASQKIKEASTGKSPVIVALSAYVDEKVREECKAHLMDECGEAPLDYKWLQQIIINNLN